MTAQINDKVFHRKIVYSLAGINGAGLFKPKSHGIDPVRISTACCRGFHVGYAVEDNQLVLKQVTVGFSKADEASARAGRGPVIFGTQPRYVKARGAWVYRGLHQPVAFTGGLMLADQFIFELYVHMGFHPAWKYRDVRELLFSKGRLTGDCDRSPQIEQARARLSKQPLRPGDNGDVDGVMQWIEKCFSRDYTR